MLISFIVWPSVEMLRSTGNNIIAARRVGMRLSCNIIDVYAKLLNVYVNVHAQ